MKLLPVLAAVLLGACSAGSRADLPALRATRSAAAEWALVNRQAAQGRLTAVYVRGMRVAARREIAAESRMLARNPAAAREAGALLALPEDAAPALIEAHAAALRKIETAVESA